MTSSPHLPRRTLLRSTAAGLLAAPAAAALTSCASSGGDSENDIIERVARTDGNPLGANPDGELEVVIFDGGFGDQYAVDAEKIYAQSYGEVDHTKTPEIQPQLQPRMVQGDPPDVIDNSGAQAMDVAALIRNDQLQDLTELLDAPSLHDPDTPVRDTLMPGTVELGQYGTDSVFTLNYAFHIYGQWYSSTALERLDVEYPRTWDEMLDVCQRAKRQGMAGWTFPGVYPYYFIFTLFPFIAKIGGEDVLRDIDNLEPNAWRHDAVRAAFDAYHELSAKGFVLEGSVGMTHEDAQAEWTAGNALFIPNGSWVENEARKSTPEGFAMAVGPPTSLDESDAMPFETFWGGPGEPFIVPSQARNVAGGLEFLRIMMGRESARNFTELVSSLSCVRGAEEGLKLGPGLASAVEMLNAAGENVLLSTLREWYRELNDVKIGGAVLNMMKGELTPDEAIDRCQKAADDTARDDTIVKFQRA